MGSKNSVLQHNMLEDLDGDSFREVDYIDKYRCRKFWRAPENRRIKWDNGYIMLEFHLVDSPSDCEKHIEFVYNIRLNHKNCFKKDAIIIRGKAIINKEANPKFTVYIKKTSSFVNSPRCDFQHMYMRFSCEIFVFYDKNGIRNLTITEDVREHQPTITIKGRKMILPFVLELHVPLLVKRIYKKRISEEVKNSLEVFIQLLLGVQVQLEKKQIKPLLKMATKYEARNVKRYCELQLIWRDDFEFSKKREFKMACKYNLNILMNQLLRDVKTLKEMSKLAKYTTEIKGIDQNISKLLIRKMYEL